MLYIRCSAQDNHFLLKTDTSVFSSTVVENLFLPFGKKNFFYDFPCSWKDNIYENGTSVNSDMLNSLGYDEIEEESGQIFHISESFFDKYESCPYCHIIIDDSLLMTKPYKIYKKIIFNNFIVLLLYKPYEELKGSKVENGLFYSTQITH